jgi:predicted RNA polymerase sigma factor
VVCGLTTAQLARAFLVPQATVAQRITRAKRKITDAGIPYRIPADDELGARLAEVLAVIYLLCNEGYLATAARAQARDLVDAETERFADTDWEQIVLLYDMLLHLAPSPVTRLHRQPGRAGRAAAAPRLDLTRAVDPAMRPAAVASSGMLWSFLGGLPANRSGIAATPWRHVLVRLSYRAGRRSSFW